MKDKLTLTKITGYALWVSNSDGTSSSIKGYYKDKIIATVESKDVWDKVEPVDLYTDGDNIYLVGLAGDGTFVDAKDEYREAAITKLKAKLTPEELELLGHYSSLK